MHKLTFGSLLLLLALFAFVVSLSEAKSVSLKHHKDGDLTIIINMGDDKTNSKKKETSEETKPKLDDTTKQIVAQVSKTISKEEEKKIAESLLTFGNELRQISNLIPGKGSEQKEMKDKLLAIANEMAKEAEKPSYMILQSSMALVVAQKKQDETKSDNSGTQTLFLPMLIEGTSMAMNALDAVGTYSKSVSKIGNWVSGKAADKLDKWGLKAVASVARNNGKSIDGFAKSVAPYEQKLAHKIAPVVKSKTFQNVKRVANVVGGAISIHSGIKFLGMSAATKLPKTFSAIKSTITKAAKVVSNKGGIVRKIAATGLKAKRSATSSLNKISTIRKFTTAAKSAKVVKSASAAKGAVHAAHGHSKFKTALHHAHAVYEVKTGAKHIQHGLAGHHGSGHSHGSSGGHGSTSKGGQSHGSSSRPPTGHNSGINRSTGQSRQSSSPSSIVSSRQSSRSSTSSGRSSTSKLSSRTKSNSYSSRGASSARKGRK